MLLVQGAIQKQDEQTTVVTSKQNSSMTSASALPPGSCPSSVPVLIALNDELY